MTRSQIHEMTMAARRQCRGSPVKSRRSPLQFMFFFEGQIVTSVAQQELYFPIFFVVVMVKHIQICLQFGNQALQFMIFTLQNLIFFHHQSQLIFKLLKLTYPFFINYRAINVNWYFYLYGHLYFDLLFDFYRSIHIHWFLYKYRLVHYYRLFVDWFFYKYLLLYDFWDFDLFYDDFWNFLLDFDILGYLYYFFYDSFRARDILRYLSFDLNWFFNDKFLNHIPRHNLIVHFCFFPQNLVLHLQFIEVPFKLIDHFFMLFARSILPIQMVKLELQPNSLFLALIQLICQSMYFLEQFFEAFLVLSIIIDINLDILVAGSRLRRCSFNFISLRLFLRNIDWYKRLNLFQIACFSICKIFLSAD